MTISVWLVVGPAIEPLSLARRAVEEQGGEYDGDMDDITYDILTTFADAGTVQQLYKSKSVSGVSWGHFGLNFKDETEVKDALIYLGTTWPDNQFQLNGSWYYDTGLQQGTHYEYDEEGEITGIGGTPTYPIPADAYLIMPDVVVYDENGDVISTTPATSNADLRDINLIAGQAPRIFL